MKSKEEIKLEFFKQFDNESFRGYQLEQCQSIWEFFEKYIQCQKDMANKKYTEEDIIKAFYCGGDAEDIESFNEFIYSLKKLKKQKQTRLIWKIKQKNILKNNTTK